MPRYKKKCSWAKSVLYPVFCHFLSPKSNQKGLAVEKSNHFNTPVAAQKKLAPALVRACGPLICEAQTVFCFFRLRDIKMEIFLRPFVKRPDTSLKAWMVLCLAKYLTGISMLTSYKNISLCE